MYTLLAGSPPFWHRKQMLMLRMILAGNYQFTSPEWDDRSDTVKDLVCHGNIKNDFLYLWKYTCLALLSNFYCKRTLDLCLMICKPFQISRMLVVNPEMRYTATDALNHPFFQQYVVAEVRHFSPLRKFKVRVYVCIIYRLRMLIIHQYINWTCQYFSHCVFFR